MPKNKRVKKDYQDMADFQSVCLPDDTQSLIKDVRRHIVSSLGNDYTRAKAFHHYKGLAYAVRERLIDRWIRTQRSYYDEHAKRVYYLSMEFLIGRQLRQNLINMQIENEARQAIEELGFTLEEVEEVEVDAGLGNGGLGRLAACFLDSLATLRIPAYGYGLRYEYGIFHQDVDNGIQIEKPDNWLRNGNIWEFDRPEFLFPVNFYGRVETYTDATGRLCHRWVDTQKVMAMACDTLFPAYGNENVINMRLWAAHSSHEFGLDFFNSGDYFRAMQDKVKSENISKVLYPSEEVPQGRELRLQQQYFLVCATFQDIVRRYRKKHDNYDNFTNRVAIQLNDTHPAIGIAELMRVLVDVERVDWDRAWEITQGTFGYTNHTVLPEALETWPVEMFGRVLPRHLQIIYEINRRFLDDVVERFGFDPERMGRMSLIQEEPFRAVRMANLAIVGSHSVNGVSALHSDILKADVFRDFYEMYPERFNNKTNGITPRRWFLQCNPKAADLAAQHIGKDFATNLDQLRKLVPLAEDPAFRASWAQVKLENKRQLAAYIQKKNGLNIDPNSMFDVQVKRIHEYKRQLLNVLHVITLYNRLRDESANGVVPRTVIFGGKAAPGYRMAKLIIRLINNVAQAVNSDPACNEALKVVFLANYCVSLAEKIMPATDLSEQISTAGYEASGTGNMKFALNGALTIGTLDGANVEIMEEVGQDNIFIFGLTAEEVTAARSNYNPFAHYEADAELKRAVDMIASGYFSPSEPGLFEPIVKSLLDYGDRYMLMADYRSYVDCQGRVDDLFLDQDAWTRKSILNTANMGKFSSDRTILEYASDIWGVHPTTIG